MLLVFSYLFYFIYSSLYSLQFRDLMRGRETDPRGQVKFSFQVFCVLVMLSPILLLFEPFRLEGDPLHIGLLFLLCGLSGALLTICAFVAQKHVEAGVTSIVVNIYTPVAIILSSIFLNEGLTNIQILGTVLLLSAMVLISKKHRIGYFRFDKYFLLMLLSGILVGVLVVGERALQHTTGFSAGTMISWWSQCIFLGITAYFVKANHSFTNIEVAVTGALRALQAFSFVGLIFIVGNLSVVSSVTTFKVVIIFIAAAIFLKEREDLPRKIFGSILAVIGLLLMH